MNELAITEQRDVVFYDDTLTAVRTTDGQIFVPVRQLCEMMGIDWSAQRQRILRDPVLSEVTATVVVTTTVDKRQSKRPSTCLPLDFISGFLFGVNANRVKPEIRERLIRYQRECYRVLNDAFMAGTLTGMKGSGQAWEALQIARAVESLALAQMRAENLAEKRHAETETRLELIEAALGASERFISAAQAAEVSQAVKAVALTLSQQSGRNQYGAVYGQLYREFSVPSYKQIPAVKFQAVMDFLNEWLQSMVGKPEF